MTRFTQETTLTKHMKKHTTNKTHHEERTQFSTLKNDQYKKRKHETHTQSAFFGSVNKTMPRNILKKHVKRNNAIKTNHNDATLYWNISNNEEAHDTNTILTKQYL